MGNFLNFFEIRTKIASIMQQHLRAIFCLGVHSGRMITELCAKYRGCRFYDIRKVQISNIIFIVSIAIYIKQRRR